MRIDRGFNSRLVCAAIAIALLAACSSNGTTVMLPPNGSPTPNGRGVDPTLNQQVTFIVRIPPVGPRASAAKRGALDAASPTPQPSALYVSPNTGSVKVTLIAVNGVSLAQPAPALPPVNVPAACSPAGCSVSVSNVAAATGVNSFSIETFTGANGTGALISSGIVNVTAPTTGPQNVGPPNSTTLTVGGFVASLGLSVVPTTFVQGLPRNAAVVVAPKDATGATIIGNSQFANPIVLSVSAAHFTFGGTGSITLTMPPSGAITLAYDGASSGPVSVNASTTDGNGTPVTVSVALNVSLPTPPPSPSPSPTPSHGPRPPSLYVLDAANNAVEEFPSPAPNATPRRSFGLNPAQLGCSNSAVAYAIPEVIGLAVDASGNSYVGNNPAVSGQPGCFGAVPQNEVFQFGPAATASAAPQASFSLPGSFSPVGYQTIALDPTAQTLLVPSSDSASSFVSIPRVLFSSGTATVASVLGGSSCLPAVGFTSCDGVHQYSPTFPMPIAVDGGGRTYIGNLTDSAGNQVIAVYGPGATAPVAIGALVGSPSTELGLPVVLSLDGNTLYVMNTPNGSSGFSNCGVLDDPTLQCADGNPHEYVTAYDTTSLVGHSVALAPLFVLGGDATGRFGTSAITIYAYTNRLAIHNGLMYVANTTGKFCDSTCDGNISAGTAAPPSEIDVYNVAGLSGAHNNVAPMLIMHPASGSVPVGVAFGPGGTATGPSVRAIRGVPAHYRNVMRRRPFISH